MNIKMTIAFAALLAALTAITQEVAIPSGDKSDASVASDLGQAAAPAEAQPAPEEQTAPEAPATPASPATLASPASPSTAETPAPATTDEIDLEEDDSALAASRPQIRSTSQTGPVTLVDIDCDDATLADILRQFRKTTGANIISSESTNLLRRVSASLRRVPWFQALTEILNARGFRLDERDGVYRVVEDKQTIPLVTKTFQLNHASAKELAELFNKSYAQKDKSGKILEPVATSFDGANVVVVTAPERIISDCVSIVKAVDHAVPQIYIEARFAELSSDARHKLGLDWSSLESWGASVKNVSGGSSWSLNPNGKVGVNNDAATVNRHDVGGKATYVTGELSLSDFSLAISAFEKDTDARIFSNPKVIVSNGKEAKVDMTTKFPNVELTSQRNTQSGTSYIDYTAKIQEIPGDKDGGLFAKSAFYYWGIELSVKPRISPDGLISVEIVPTISQLTNDENLKTDNGFYQIGSSTSTDSANAKYPIIDVKSISTEFTMKSGSTAVIGGLSKTTEEDVDSGIPYLREIPWIGPKLFGWKSRQKVQKEIIIFVTLGIANPESLPKDLGLPKNAVMGREYVNGTRLEPGDRDGSIGEVLKLDMRPIKDQKSEGDGHVKISVSNDQPD